MQGPKLGLQILRKSPSLDLPEEGASPRNLKDSLRH